MVGYLDLFSRGNSVCHRLSTHIKLAGSGMVILGSLLLPARLWQSQLALIGLTLVAHTLAGIPWKFLFHRVIRFLPFVLVFCLSLYFGSSSIERHLVLVNLVLRSLTCFLAALWIVNVAPFDELLKTLARIGLPGFAVAVLAFMYRYLYVVFDELERMKQARQARTFGSLSLTRIWALKGQLIGMLLIRGISRAERVHGAMCARGWDGSIRNLKK